MRPTEGVRKRRMREHYQWQTFRRIARTMSVRLTGRRAEGAETGGLPDLEYSRDSQSEPNAAHRRGAEGPRMSAEESQVGCGACMQAGRGMFWMLHGRAARISAGVCGFLAEKRAYGCAGRTCEHERCRDIDQARMRQLMVSKPPTSAWPSQTQARHFITRTRRAELVA